MEIEKAVLAGVYAALMLYLLYKLFFSKNPYQKEYEKLYNKILNSREHKVKGQYDRD